MSGFANFSHIIQDYYVAKVREANRLRSQRIARLANKEEALAYVNEVREKIANCFSLPAEKTPLEPQITGVIERDGLRLEKIIYYSRPGFPVTANLYLPKNAQSVPGVIFLCGHANNGKGSETYQSCCISLAMQGYAVLAIDPANQGERNQFIGVDNAGGIKESCTNGHNMAGKQQLLVGENFGSWRAWDAVRGLDYLLSRPEVDSTRIGITGNSGGGTMTSFVSALDSRFTMMAPSCYITSWRRNLENELPADIEQIPPGILSAGCEMGDLILAHAPRPSLIMGQKNDFFDHRGLKETFDEVRKVYALLGAEDKLQMFIGPTNHGYSIENREAMYKFFNKHAGITKFDGKEPEHKPFAEKETYCTPDGQVASIPGIKMIRHFTMEIADRLSANRPSPNGGELRKLFSGKYGLNLPEVPYYRILRHTAQHINTPMVRYFNRFAVETEPNMLSVLKLCSYTEYYHLPQSKQAVLYVPNFDAQSEMEHMECNNDTMFYGLDVRGIGETTPSGCDQDSREFFAPYRFDYHFASCGLLFDDVLPICRARDIWSTVRLLTANGVKKIELIARGLGTIPAVLAALMIPEITKVTLHEAPESWDAMVRTPISMWPQSAMIPGILASCDLPDIYRAIREEKSLTISSFANQMLRTK